MINNMENLEKILTGGADSPLLVGLAAGEALNNAYLISKGVRNVAMSQTWGTDSLRLFEALANYCKGLSGDDCSRAVSFRTVKLGNDQVDILIYANSHKKDAERLCELLTSTPPTPDRAKEIGEILGYNQILVERFADKERAALSFATAV